MAAALKLHTFALSHFSEKIRWLLDASAAPYVEEGWVPFLHIAKALKKGGGRATTVPVLDIGDGQYVQDSTRILLWLAEHRAPFALLPSDPALREAVLAVEDRFDRIGSLVIRYAYSVALDQREGIIRLWTLDATAGQTRTIRLVFPLLRALARRKFKLHDAAAVAHAEQSFGEGLDWIAERIGDGREFLVGGRLSAADITAAALLAPIACPDEHPVYSRKDYRDGVAALCEKWQAHPAMHWVRAMYRNHRR